MAVVLTSVKSININMINNIFDLIMPLGTVAMRKYVFYEIRFMVI